VPTIEENGRVAACEVLTMTGRVRDMIVDINETGKLYEAIAEGSYYGMQTFEQSLLHHYQEGRISLDAAMHAATHPHDFKLMVESEGRRSTSVDQLYSYAGNGDNEGSPDPEPAPSPGSPFE
jgi:twitching motility protein PilT